MRADVASLIALLLVIAGSLTSRINVGILAVAFAWPIAVFLGKWKLDQLMAAFPSNLFVTLLGVTLLFGVAQTNGTLNVLTQRALQLCKGNARLIPVLLFVLACAISTLGPGAIAAVALVAPVAMRIGTRAGVPMLLTALMIGNGANAGNLSPISTAGIAVQSFMGQAGLGGHEWVVFGAGFFVHLLAATGAYFLFGGLRLSAADVDMAQSVREPLTTVHSWTIAVIVLWSAGIVVLQFPPGPSAFVGASALILSKAGDDHAVLASIPWSVIVMVSGVSVLIGVLDKTGGLDLFTTMLSQIATPATVNGTIAMVTGLISSWSSTIGVVYPTFLPAVPGLVEKLGGGDPLAISLSIAVGSALVDVSPLSTIGALCIAGLPPGADEKELFRKLLAWGYSMVVVGAIFCQLFIGPYVKVFT